MKFILGFTTGHSGSTTIDAALRRAECGWNVVGKFEQMSASERRKVEEDTISRGWRHDTPRALDCSLTDEEILPFLLQKVDAEESKQMQSKNDTTYTYIDMGHFHNRFRTLECLADRLGQDVAFVRIRRNRYSIAISFAHEFTTPCLYSKDMRDKSPDLTVCPRSGEGNGEVNLPVTDDVWDSMTPFQKFLWYADEMEHRWHTLASHTSAQMYEITWSDPYQLQGGVYTVLTQLGCSDFKPLPHRKKHKKHIESGTNCSTLIRQDMSYRRMMNYDAATLNVLVSPNLRHHVDMKDCVETKLELERVVREEE